VTEAKCPVTSQGHVSAAFENVITFQANLSQRYFLDSETDGCLKVGEISTKRDRDINVASQKRPKVSNNESFDGVYVATSNNYAELVK